VNFPNLEQLSDIVNVRDGNNQKLIILIDPSSVNPLGTRGFTESGPI